MNLPVINIFFHPNKDRFGCYDVTSCLCTCSHHVTSSHRCLTCAVAPETSYARRVMIPRIMTTRPHVANLEGKYETTGSATGKATHFFKTEAKTTMQKTDQEMKFMWTITFVLRKWISQFFVTTMVLQEKKSCSGPCGWTHFWFSMHWSPMTKCLALLEF